MDSVNLEWVAFLKQQLEWHKEQDQILARIECKLFEMKEITENRLADDVSFLEIKNLQDQVDQLTLEIADLERKLASGIVH